MGNIEKNDLVSLKSNPEEKFKIRDINSNNIADCLSLDGVRKSICLSELQLIEDVVIVQELEFAFQYLIYSE